MKKALIEYYPPELKKVLEYQLISETGQHSLNNLFAEVQKIMDRQFIASSDEIGIRRYEQIYGITPKATDSLEDRRFRILTKINETLPYTIPRLKQMMEALCGAGNYSVELDAGAYTLTVKVGLAAKNSFEDVEAMLNRVVPANMIIDLSQLYNTHEEVSAFTHAQLSARTHYQLRNEVLNNG